MDSNEGDLARISNSKRLNETKYGPIPVAALSDDLREAFEDAHICAACPVIDGQIWIQPADSRHCARHLQQFLTAKRLPGSLPHGNLQASRGQSSSIEKEQCHKKLRNRSVS